jgi:hypothetical protein
MSVTGEEQGCGKEEGMLWPDSIVALATAPCVEHPAFQEKPLDPGCQATHWLGQPQQRGSASPAVPLVPVKKLLPPRVSPTCDTIL